MNTPAKPAVSPASPSAGNSPASPAKVDDAVKQVIQAQKRRKPMSAPVRRLEATPIPGFKLHWIKEQNLRRAAEAGYAHVLIDETQVNSRNVSVPSEVGSTSDLSNRVSVQYGGDTLYLMKLPESLYAEDMAIIADRNKEVWQQIFRGEMLAGEAQANPGDTSERYLKEASVSGGDVARASRSKVPLFARKFK